MVHMNKDAFDALSPELQEIVLSTAKEVEDELWAGSQARIELNVQRLAEANVTAITDVPEAFIDELKAAGQQALDEWRELMGDQKADEILAAYAAELQK